VLLEIEKDERYDKQNSSNHKIYIDWKEFLDYFNDFQEIEVRNSKKQDMTQHKKLKDAGDEEHEEDQETQMKSLLEQEKERRLQDLPRLRPADQIDISEGQLTTIKKIFDSQGL